VTPLFRHPAGDYALLWPLVDLGRDAAAAAAYGGVGSAAIAKGTLPLWAVRLERAQRWRLPVSGHRDALACVADLGAQGAKAVTLYQGARVRADGRILWAATDRFSTTPSPEILAPTGVILKAKLDPFRPDDFKGLTRRAAADLAAADAAAGLPAVDRFVDRLQDVTQENSADELKRAAAALRTEQRGLDRAWMDAADPHFKGMAQGTRGSVKDRFLGAVEIDISAPQVAAVERLVAQQSWFVRGMDGQRNDALTLRARKIVAAGFAQGLGRAEVADDLRKQLPDLWQGMGKGYAHTVAANGLARARSHAELSTYAEGGIEYAEVVAMLDERTTDICFLGNTKILTEAGERAIELIHPGDKVVTGFGFLGTVLKRSKRLVHSIVRVRTSSGRQLYVTEEHPFLTRHGWQPAGALCSGDVVSTRHRSTRPPREVAWFYTEYLRRRGEQADPWAELPASAYAERCANVLVTEVDVFADGMYDVYNLEVQDDPTYVAETVVVHNCRLMDGQVIPIAGALDLANRAAAVTTPEDIGKVAPFLRQTRNDQGAMEIHAGKTLLGRFEREGSGNVDDRGRAQQFVAGAGFNGANVGAPPYHHNCRTTLVPRMDVAQVPKGSAMRAVGPAPSENGDWTSFGALEQFKMPTPSKPVVTGTLTPVDDYGLPRWKAPDAGTRRAIGASAEVYGVRTMGSDPMTRGFDEAAPWARAQIDELATNPGLFATPGHAVMHLTAQSSSRAALGALVANPASAGRSRLVQMVDTKGETIWARFTGRMTKAMADAAMAVRLATTPAEAQVAAEELLRIAELAGAVRIGKTVDAVSNPATARVTMGTSGLPARSPLAKPRTTGAQPQTGTKPNAGPSPLEEPAGPRLTGALKDAPIGAQLYAARPDGAIITKAQWKQEHAVWSSATVDANGVPVKRSEWAALSDKAVTFQTSLRVIRPQPSDHVVNVTATQLVNPRFPASRRFLVSALEAEVASNLAGKRDWVVNDHEGNAVFLRIDGAVLGKVPTDVFTRVADAWIQTGNAEKLAKLGVELFTDVRQAYPKARIDWNQRNLIPGVPVHEQVDKRLAIVRDEVQGRIRKEEERLGRALKTAEKGQIITKIVKEGAAKAKPSDVLVDRTAKMTPAQVAAQTAADRATVSDKIKGSLEMQRGETARKALDFALQHCSDPVVQAVAAMGAPRFYRSLQWRRGFMKRRLVLFGEDGEGAFISMPDNYERTLSGQSGRAAVAGRRVLKHEGAHLVDRVGKNGVAARIVRNRLARDVDNLLKGDISLYGKGGTEDEYALPGAFMDRYDAKVYGEEAKALIKNLGKPLKAKDYQTPASIDEYDTRTNTEFLSTAVERLSSAAEIGKNWEVAADQVAFMISALRGHYVPH
jgi:hypothetical protein